VLRVVFEFELVSQRDPVVARERDLGLQASPAAINGAAMHADQAEAAALVKAQRINNGVGAFSESLRQEVTRRYVRVSLVEPGATATELASHNRPEVLHSIRSQFGQTMDAGDIADAIAYIVTRPRHVTVNEMLIRPTEQER
jgi:NADP-dependent 3-hydroxy acid dehydrogenase YdfG